MSIGPVEVVVIAFPGSRFNGRVLPELARVLDAGTIRIVDGLLASRDADGTMSFVEIDDAGQDEEVSGLAALCDRFDELISEDDVAELTSDLEPGSSAAILVFEHTWMRPLRDAIVDSGGVLAADVRIPGEVVDEVLAALGTAS